MISESAVIKYFKDAWKNRIILENYEGTFLLGDNSVLIKIPGNPYKFKLFNDRAMFPKLPEIGERIIYSKTSSFCSDPMPDKLLSVFILKHLNNVGLVKMTLTPWLLKTKVNKVDISARLCSVEKTPVFVNQIYLNLFEGWANWMGTCSNNPVVLLSGESRDMENFEGLVAPLLGVAQLKPDEVFPSDLAFELAEES